MPEIKTAPYGSWKSPITSDLIVSGTINLGDISKDSEEIYWIESRPMEGGRYVLIKRSPDGSTQEITPKPYNVRTRVHEYGGAAYRVYNGTVYFSNFSDQRLYRQAPGSEPAPVTPEADYRYADARIDERRNRLICVREDHTNPDQEAMNTIVQISLNQASTDSNPGEILVSGNDFYAYPRISPDGQYLAWTTWNHPNLPWDGTEIWLGEFAEDGSIANARLVAGGPEESIYQPEWSPDGILYFVSDRSGWWNLYRDRQGELEAIYPMQAEFGEPQWVFGSTTYGFDSKDRIICTYTQEGTPYLASLDIPKRALETFNLPFSDIWGLKVFPGEALFLAGSPVQPYGIIKLNLDDGNHEMLRSSSDISIDIGYISIPESIKFPTEGGKAAYGFYYPPLNRDYNAPPGELPPLIVMSHGGPTGSTSTLLSLGIQYWTSRGLAVLDVNYGGSTGYGREYRKRLEGQWGVVDVDDCVNGAKYLVELGKVDGDRLAIRGGSAGGYTTLCALTFRDVFKAGASHFGIGDLETFVHDTHKFESRYLDRLVGPYPERGDLYRERSPINYTDQLSCAIILFQGLEDKIVPPNQAETMFEAVKKKGLPVAYLPFEGEQHGFRKGENIKRALDAELYFYSKVFGFELAEPVEPVEIENL